MIDPTVAAVIRMILFVLVLAWIGVAIALNLQVISKIIAYLRDARLKRQIDHIRDK
jgi:UPF0716 family protein affecting phage T7 exclusion